MQGEEKILKEVMTGNFPKLLTEMEPQMQETQRISRRHIIAKCQKIKDKEKLLEKVRGINKNRAYPPYSQRKDKSEESGAKCPKG